MTQSIFVGQLEIVANCDLVSILHREPRMHEATHTFTGEFESKPYWTSLTPAKARDLAKALETVAGELEACEAAKASSISRPQSGSEA